MFSPNYISKLVVLGFLIEVPLKFESVTKVGVEYVKPQSKDSYM